MTDKSIDAAAGHDEREQESVARLVNAVFAEDDPQAVNGADWLRLRAALATRSRGPSLWRRGVLVTALAGAIGLVIFAFAARPLHRIETGQAVPSVGTKESPLTYLVQGQAGTNIGFVHGERSAGTSLVFSDGSRIHFNPESVGRVLSSRPDGAGVLVENGQAQFQIKHRLTTAWAIYAGPFTVRVTGTAFELAWSASERTLQLNMTEGSVLVQGPLMDPGVRLVAGQTLRARADGEKVEVTGVAADAAPTASAPPPAVGAIDDSVARAAPGERLKRSLKRRSSARVALRAGPSPAPQPAALASRVAAPNWAERVAAGDFEAVLASARGEGIQRCLTERPLGDLFALADAARYAGDRRLATQALLRVRARFPHATEAPTAAFLLGRLSEQHQASAAAVEWFDRYLQEAPQGPYAGLAFGHKMLLVGQTGERHGVAELAREYLAHYPDGPYASAARDLLKNP
jgi:TolA-binding protein